MGREATQVGWGGETWAGAGREEKGGSGRPGRREKEEGRRGRGVGLSAAGRGGERKTLGQKERKTNF